MLVPNTQFPGQGGQAALPPGHRPSDYPGIDYTPPVTPVGGNGANGGTPAAPSVGFRIPNNFWGFVILMIGMR